MINTIKIAFWSSVHTQILLLALSRPPSAQCKVFSACWGPSMNHLSPGHKINTVIDSPLEASVAALQRPAPCVEFNNKKEVCSLHVFYFLLVMLQFYCPLQTMEKRKNCSFLKIVWEGLSNQSKLVGVWGAFFCLAGLIFHHHNMKKAQKWKSWVHLASYELFSVASHYGLTLPVLLWNRIEPVLSI